MGAAVKAAPIKTKVFSVESFWKESLTTGAIAEKLVQIHRAKIDPEQAYVAGCFANIGKIIGALLLPDITDKIEAMVTSPKTQCTWLEAEKKHSLYDHSVLGEIGACLWGFSEEHRVVARFHHTPYRLRKDHPSFELCEIIALANQLSHWYSLNPHRVDRALIKQISTKVGLSDTALEGFVNELEISFTDFS
jgi:HD-like signal output (HDOD) protein